jgi:hypothetical protein
MAHAQVLVVNHALYFADLAVRRSGASLLPPHDIVILDEAHTVEAVASEHLGISVSSGGVERVLSKLHSERTHRGLLTHYKMHDLELDVRRCRRAAEAFFMEVREVVGDRSGPPWRIAAAGLVPNSLGEHLQSLSRRLRAAADGIGIDLAQPGQEALHPGPEHRMRGHPVVVGLGDGIARRRRPVHRRHFPARQDQARLGGNPPDRRARSHITRDAGHGGSHGHPFAGRQES